MPSAQSGTSALQRSRTARAAACWAGCSGRKPPLSRERPELDLRAVPSYVQCLHTKQKENSTMEPEKVVVKRRDGSTFETVISSLDLEMSCAVVRHRGKKVVIVEVDEGSAIWWEVPKHRRGEVVILEKKS